ncbi:hypothetical protein ACFLT7_08420, partial [candidate division KSB1 bacterium]
MRRTWFHIALILSFIRAFAALAAAQDVEPRFTRFQPLEVHPDSILYYHLIERLTELPWMLKPESTRAVVQRDYVLDFETGTISTRDLVGETPVTRHRVLDLKTHSDSLWWSTLRHQQGYQLNHPYVYKPEERRRTTGQGQGMLPQIVLPDVLPSALGDFLGGATPTINFSGQENLSFSGDSRYYLNRARDETFRNSKFPQLQMEQELNVQIEGRVGEKLSINLAHDSKMEEQFKNKVKIQYQGDEDEIIKLIEAGDTDLSISGPQFIAGTFPHKGLFGAKMMSQIGPLEMTLIASKERGSSDRGNFEGQAVADTISNTDLQYEKRRFYFIERPDFLYKHFPDTVFAERLPRLESVRIYLDNGTVYDDAQTGAIPGVAFNYFAVPDADSRSWRSEDLADLAKDDDYIWGNFDLLERGTDYIVTESGLIYLREQLRDTHTLAVSYTDSEKTWGIATGDTLQLKMLKRAGQTVPLLQPEVRGLWDYEMKNVYTLGARDLNKQSVDVTIFRTSREGGGKDEEFYNQNTTYLQLLGMDNKGPGTPEPDGRIDPEWIDEERGLLFIPFLQPFIDAFAAVGDQESQNLRVYWDDTPKGDHSRYKIVITYKSVKSTYSLGRLNILEGSESVRI